VPMKNPPHPGRMIREANLRPFGLTVTSGAKILGVSRQALSNLVNQRACISLEMAIRLDRALGVPAQTWLRMQCAYDLARALKAGSRIRVRRYRGPLVDEGADSERYKTDHRWGVVRKYQVIPHRNGV